MPKARHSRGLTMPVTSGRCEVRSISASMSRSMYMFSALAPPADKYPPKQVARTSHSDGTPCSARNITGTVVISRSSMIRGLVKATKAMTRAPNGR